MSLYAFGKLKGGTPAVWRTHMERLSREAEAQVSLATLDLEDAGVLDAASNLSGEGATFTVQDGPDCGEATGLWNEANVLLRNHIQEAGQPSTGEIARLAREEFSRTRLGRICFGLMDLPGVIACGLALVDGGIERVRTIPAESWMEELALECLRPWDQASNTLFVLLHDRHSGLV